MLTISFIVVINGPLATAGSMPILFINNGISDPIVVPTVIAVVKLIPTIVANNGWPYSITMIENSIRLHTKPEIKPLADSCNACLTLFSFSISPVEILRTETANDCVPVLPDIPLIIGINAASRATYSSVSSNEPNIVAVIIPKNVSKISHGKRFFAVCKTDSFVSFTSLIPANFE